MTMPSLQERVAEFMTGLHFKWDDHGEYWHRNGTLLLPARQATFWYKQTLAARKDVLEKLRPLVEPYDGNDDVADILWEQIATLDQLLKEEGNNGS